MLFEGKQKQLYNFMIANPLQPHSNSEDLVQGLMIMNNNSFCTNCRCVFGQTLPFQVKGWVPRLRVCVCVCVCVCVRVCACTCV